MNACNGKDSTISLLVPYSNGDAEKGFVYSGGDITEQQYSRMMIDTYNKYKDGVREMYTERCGYNMAINNFDKEIVKYTQQQFFYDETKVNIYNGDGSAMTIDELIGHFQVERPFIMVINMYKMGDNSSLESDMKVWMRECLKITRNPMFSEVEKIQYLSKKNMKIKFDDAKSSAVLYNCKMVDVKNNTTFVFIVEKIIFVTDGK